MFFKKLSLYSVVVATLLAGGSSFASAYADVQEPLSIEEVQELTHTLDQIKVAPGDYSPVELIEVAAVSAVMARYDDAATYYVAAMLRVRIDAIAADDPSLGDVPVIFAMRFNQIVSENMSTEQKATFDKLWPKLYIAAYENALEWDMKTPRNYDRSWVLQHSMKNFTGEEVKAISDERYADAVKEVHELYREQMAEVIAEAKKLME